MHFFADASEICYYTASMKRPTLTVHLSALVKNWELLCTQHGNAQVGATVKANAYGLGVHECALALQKAGCKHFFVATLQEALTLREALTDAPVYVFQGMLKGEAEIYAKHHISPVINNLKQLQNYNQHKLPAAALHIDSGMQRLGFDISELTDDVLKQIKQSNIALVMTHYACASEPEHPLNHQQLSIMQRAKILLPHLPTSYANSAAHFLPKDYHGDITRPGCALYGINPCDNSPNPMHHVATLSAPILQVRTMQEATTIGYMATKHLRKNTKVVTAAIGYADGIHRTASNALYGFIGDYKLPLVGRVTMDACCFDASHVPVSVLEQADMIEIMNERQTVNHLAQIYGTIGYEVLTSLGQRIERQYVD